MDTKDIILKVSKEEFLSKGYNDAFLNLVLLKM